MMDIAHTFIPLCYLSVPDELAKEVVEIFPLFPRSIGLGNPTSSSRGRACSCEVQGLSTEQDTEKTEQPRWTPPLLAQTAIPGAVLRASTTAQLSTVPS